MDASLPRTRDILDDGIANRLHLGAQVYVSRHGQTIADLAIGEKRAGEPMSADDITLWMSAGKPIAAVWALRLVEAGALSLDLPVAELIPGFAQHGKGAITLRHILTHTGGFRGPLNNFTEGTWDEIITRVSSLRLEPQWVPCEKAGYHIGSSWFVLGELIRLSGESIDGLVPWLDDVWMSIPDHDQPALHDRLAPMHIVEEGTLEEDYPGNEFSLMSIPRPGASCRGPIRALGRFYERLMNGELLGRAMVDAMRSRQRAGMMDHTFRQVLDWGWGVMLDSKHYAGEHSYGYGKHASPDAFGHSGNQSSCGFVDPVHDLVIAWTCNGMPGEAAHQTRARAINAAIYEDLGIA
jgi:CubicO group peptidase (beta-lactamase class C family)